LLDFTFLSVNIFFNLPATAGLNLAWWIEILSLQFQNYKH